MHVRDFLLFREDFVVAADGLGGAAMHGAAAVEDEYEFCEVCVRHFIISLS